MRFSQSYATVSIRQLSRLLQKKLAQSLQLLPDDLGAKLQNISKRFTSVQLDQLKQAEEAHKKKYDQEIKNLKKHVQSELGMSLGEFRKHDLISLPDDQWKKAMDLNSVFFALHFDLMTGNIQEAINISNDQILKPFIQFLTDFSALQKQTLEGAKQDRQLFSVFMQESEKIFQ